MAFSIRLTEEERRLADSYAKIHAISVGEAFKRAFFEKVEDEYDIAVANHAYNEYVKDGKRSRPIDELWKELEL
ncbi:MAG: DUF6290 family protein [Lachnospiraceae bacterium]|nr:DUF6290 family protein [Lachnospiraceae bacterium]